MEWIKENLIQIEVWIVIVMSLVGIVGAWMDLIKEMKNDKGTKESRELLESDQGRRQDNSRHDK